MRTSFFSTLLTAGLGLVAAAPTDVAVAAPVLEERAVTVTAADLANFVYYKQFASAAYCNADFNKIGKKTVCSANACPDLTAGNVVNYIYLDTDTSIQTDGMIFIDHTRKNIVLTFRGSKTAEAYFTDINFSMTEAPEICSGCKLHRGLYGIWNTVASTAKIALSTAAYLNPTYKLVFTGHSSGAAAASIGAAYVRQWLRKPVELYTFGSPRVGNEAWANFVTAQGQTAGNGNFRITHYDDIVAALPPSLFGFRHISPEYWLKDKDASSPNYPLQDIVVCEGIDPNGCRSSMGATLSGTAHGQYFGKISACYGS